MLRAIYTHGVRSLQGFSIPDWIGQSDELWVIEIRIVSPPYLLDFGKAWIDEPPDFPADAMEMWEASGIELFGEERWCEVKGLLFALEKYGIYYYDAKPGNIRFHPESSSS